MGFWKSAYRILSQFIRKKRKKRRRKKTWIYDTRYSILPKKLLKFSSQIIDVQKKINDVPFFLDKELYEKNVPHMGDKESLDQCR